MRSRFLRGGLIVVATVMALALMLLAAVHLPLVRARVLEWARTRVSSDFGVAVEADGLSYNLLGISVDLQNVSLSAPGERPFLQADRLRVLVDRRLFLGTVAVNEVEVVRPRIAIVRHRDGSTNLPASQNASSSKPTPIHLGIVSIRQMSVDLLDESGGHRGAAGPIDLTLDTRAGRTETGRFGPGAISVDVGGGEPGAARSIAGTFGGGLGFDGERLSMNDVRIDTPDGRLTLNGRIDLIAETVRVEAQGRLETDLARIGRFMSSVGDSLQGTAVADLAVSGPVADPAVRVVGSGRNLRYQTFSAESAAAEATYADGRIDLQRLDVTSDLGTAGATGSVQLVTTAGSRGGNQLRAHVASVDIDRVLAAADVHLPLRLGSTATGDVDVTLDDQDPFAADWWQHLAGAGSVQLAPAGSGLALEGRLNIGVKGDRWTVEHQLRSPAGPTTAAGVVSGQAGQSADGRFESTLSGQSRVRIDALHALTPFGQQAGFELPAPLKDLDGSVDAVVDPRGTFAAPRALATISGRGLRVPNVPEGQLDGTLAIDRRAAKVESLQARLGATTLTASGTYSWSGRIDGQFDATADDLTSLAHLATTGDLPVSGSASLVGTLQGTAQAPLGRAELSTRGLSAYDVTVGAMNAQISLANERVVIDATAPALSARLQGSVGIREPYRFQAEGTLDRASITSLLPPTMRDQLAIEGNVTTTVKSEGVLSRPLDSRAELSLRSLDMKLTGVPVVLEAPATVSIEPNAFTATRVDLRAGDSTHIQLEGTLGLTETRAGLNVRADGPLSDVLAMAAATLPDTSINAETSSVSLDLHVGGTLLAPQPTGTVALKTALLRYADQPPLTDVAVDARVEPTRVAVQSITANWLGARLEGQGSVPLRMIVPASLSSRTAATGVAAWGSNWLASLPAEPRSATVTARMTGVTTDALVPFVDPATLKQISGNVDATLTAEADGFALDQVRGSLILDQASLVVAEVPFKQSAPTRVRLADGRGHIEEFRWNAEGNELRVSGDADLSAPDRPVDLAVNGDIDLRVLSAFVSGVASGGVAHSALTVKGPIAAPDILGSIAVSGGELRLDTPSVAASDIEGTIVIPADRNAAIALKGTVNGGSATVQGNVSLADITAPTGRLIVAARNMTLDYPEGFQTESNADLVFTLGATNSALTGRIDVLSGIYREPLVVSRALLSGLGGQAGVTSEGETSFLSTLTLDVTVATAEQVRVDNNYGRLNLTANLQVTGTANQPGAVGRIEAEPDGEIYLAGNTYRVESLVVDLANPRAIAPDVSFLADTRVGNVPIEVALQCSAAGVCEREVRSQATGVTNEQAEALLYGITTDSDAAEAGAQLARLLSGELLGIVGQSFRLDTLRLEQAAGRSDLFDDPTLVAGDVNPASRLTIGKRLGEHVQLAYSQNLAQNGFTMSTSYFAPAGISVRALLLDDQSRSYEFRHEPRFGRPARKRPVAASNARVTAIRFSGNPGFPERDLRRQLHVNEGDRFGFVDWQADRERLIAFYQTHGFFEVRVRARRLLPEGGPLESAPPGSSVDAIVLEYAIERGRPTRLDISGFDVPDRIRQQIIKRWASAIFDGFLERDATLIVREYLYSANRLESTVVATTERQAADDGKTLRVTIDPGRATVPRLVFEGNAVISTAALIDAAERAGPLAAWLDPASFALVIARLYHDDGLLSAEVSVQPPQIQQDASVVRVVIREGEPWMLGRVTVDGGGVLGSGGSNDALGLSANDRYSPKTVAERIVSFEQRFRDAGFLGAHVMAENSLDTSAHRVNVHVIAEPGPRTVLTSVTVEGSPEDRAAVERHLKLEAGAPLSASALSGARRTLYETGAYRSVDIDLEPVAALVVGDARQPVVGDARQPVVGDAGQPVVGDALQGVPGVPADRKVVAHIRVQERPRYTLRYGLAVNDEVVSADQRRQEIGFAADLENKNVLGLGATLGVSARLRRDQEVGRVYLGVPRSFGLPIQSTLFLSRSRQDTASGGIADVTEITAQQTYRLRRLATVSYGYGLGRNRTANKRSNFDITVRLARLSGNAAIERRNDPFDPSRGWFTSSNVELSRPGLGSELSFLRSFFQQFQFVPIRHDVVIASAVRLGLARAYRGDPLIQTERFFAGGATSVRGYDEDALGAQSALGGAEGGVASLIANGEARFPIYRWLRGVGFLDLGNVYPSVADLFHTGVQVGTGGGVRVNTPVGLIRLDFGVPVNRRPIDPKWTVQFGLGHAF